MRIVSRTQWGARYPDGFRAAPLPAAEVWLHHSAGPALTGPGVIRDLEAVGQSRFGGGMSYTFLVSLDGTVYEGHSIGRQGSHTADRNHRARGICLVGNYETAHPSRSMIEATAELLRHGQARGWWRTARLAGGHRDVKATACPGRHAYALIGEINRLAANPVEDDMPSPAELWSHRIRDPFVTDAKRPDAYKPAADLVGWSATHAARALAEATAAKVAATEALKAVLADRDDVDTEQLIARIDATVRQALVDAVVDVDVTVTSNTDKEAPS